MKLLAIIVFILPAFSGLVADPQTDSEYCKLINDESCERNIDSIEMNEIEINMLETEITKIENDLNVEVERNRRQKEMYTLGLFRSELLKTHPTLCLPETNLTTEHLVKISYSQAIGVVCDAEHAGPGWIVIQRRIDSTRFDRSFDDYEQGFGDPNGSFFIGLKKLYQLTSLAQHELYIYLESIDKTSRFAKYSNFKISGNGWYTRYNLDTLGKFEGNAGDSLRNVVGKKFMPKCSSYDDNIGTPWWTACYMHTIGYANN